MTDPTGTTPPRRGAKGDKENPVPVPGGKESFQHHHYLEYREGLPYLPLKWRLAWLRADHPQAKITTRLVSHENGLAVFSAEVQLPEGGLGTGWGVKGKLAGHQNPEDQFNYILEAENQALSRALASVGYGTEYVYDYDPPAENQPITLPEQYGYEGEDEAPGIEVPLNENEPEDRDEEPAVEEPPARREDGPRETGTVVPLPSPRGEVRSIFEKRPQQDTRPAAEPRPVRPPAAPPEAPAGPTPLAGPNPVVEDRMKNIRDEQLRLTIKQIYYEANRYFRYDENRVDDRSREIYGKPAFELDLDEAEKYLERIRTAPKRRS